MRDIELRLADSNGKAVLRRETVAASRQIQQPIMCFGHLMANGWGVNAAECTLEHSCGCKRSNQDAKSISCSAWLDSSVERGTTRAFGCEGSHG